MTTIESDLFRWCFNLEEISLGKGLQSINDKAFTNCASIKKITCHSEIPPYAQIYAFNFGTYDKADVYVPQENLNDYKIDNFWKMFQKLHGADLTTIDDVVIGGTQDNEQRIFDLQGRKLKKPMRGLNIINGRKVLVK